MANKYEAVGHPFVGWRFAVRDTVTGEYEKEGEEIKSWGIYKNAKKYAGNKTSEADAYEEAEPEAHDPGPAIKVRVLPHGAGLPLPEYQTAHAAGMDLLAACASGWEQVLEPGQSRLVPTGLVIELPEGFEAQIRPRSGLALKHGVTVLNSPGTIDADYRGEVKVLLINHGRAAFLFRRGSRIAQMVVAPVARARLEVVEELSESGRGAGGFGSTGIED